MNSAMPSDVQKSLETIAQHVPTSPTHAPAEFVRELARRWKERGGFLAGKPRHSDRYLDDLLRLQGTPIRSLTPKLVGRTNLKPRDAEVLVRLFLSHWDYIGDPHSGEIAARSADLYTPMLSDAEVDGVCGYVGERIAIIGGGARSEAETPPASSLPGQDMINLIATEFQKSKVLFTIGASQILLVPRPEGALIGFRNLMQELWQIDRDDREERILVWTLDLGRQDFDDPESRFRFLNVEALVTRFKALKRFKESDTEARWNWLNSRAVVVLHDTRSVRPDVPRLPAFDPHHVLFSAIPPKWAGTSEFLALYGREGERIPQLTYTVFLRRSADQTAPRIEMNANHLASFRNYELHYFGHAVLADEEKGEQEARGLQLNAPGRSYVEALGTVFVAAAHVLGLQAPPAGLSIDGMKMDPTHALEKLRHHGFLLLRLDEFIKF
jgi:hypothetical protein